MTLTEVFILGPAIGVLNVHVFAIGSYISTVLP